MLFWLFCFQEMSLYFHFPDIAKLLTTHSLSVWRHEMDRSTTSGRKAILSIHSNNGWSQRFRLCSCTIFSNKC